MFVIESVPFVADAIGWSSFHQVTRPGAGSGGTRDSRIKSVPYATVGAATSTAGNNG
jgi:hypothetical protein